MPLNRNLGSEVV